MWATNAEQVNVWTRLEDGTYVCVDCQERER